MCFPFPQRKKMFKCVLHYRNLSTTESHACKQQATSTTNTWNNTKYSIAVERFGCQTTEQQMIVPPPQRLALSCQTVRLSVRSLSISLSFSTRKKKKKQKLYTIYCAFVIAAGWRIAQDDDHAGVNTFRLLAAMVCVLCVWRESL